MFGGGLGALQDHPGLGGGTHILKRAGPVSPGTRDIRELGEQGDPCLQDPSPE